MKRLGVFLAVLLVIPIFIHATPKTYVSFEATVTRIEPWRLIKVSCGLYANYRLAEYRIDAVYNGKFARGQVVVLRHLACNYNELDDLKAGDKVLVVAEVLDKPVTSSWYKGVNHDEENVRVEYRGLSIGKLVYPTSDSPR